MRTFWLVIFFIIISKGYSQINPADSTVQVIAYWDKNEKHSYSFTFKKLKVNDKDTITTQDIRYKADIKIVDSIATGYTVEWKYRDYSFGNVTGKVINDNGISGLIKLFQNHPIKFKTDENGTFVELINWEELSDKLNLGLQALRNNSKLSPELILLSQQPLNRENIEDLLLKDVQLFYMFFGLKLNLGVPAEDQIDSGNSITGPVKSDISLLLENIDFEDLLYKVSYYQVYDEDAISKLIGPIAAGFLSGKLTELESSEINNIKFSSFEDFYISLFHDSGWLISLLYDRVVSLETKEQLIERRTILFEE